MVKNMIKFAICDDEPFMVQELSGYLTKYMQEKHLPHSIHTFSNGQALLESSCDFDLIFLDIQMEQPDGMETARRLRQQGNPSLLIFVTILKECVFDAFEVEAYDFLVKPLEHAHFRRTMNRAIRSLEQQPEKNVVVRRGISCDVVPLSQIVYCEIQSRKIYIHQNNGNILDYYEQLGSFEQRVDGRFFRCHRSYLVNLDYVRGIRAGEVILSQGDKLPVPKKRERDLTQALLRRMKERNS